MSMIHFSVVTKWVAWNLFLAVVPVVLGWMVYGLSKSAKRNDLIKALILFLGLVWLAFLPNTCYLITEWRHYLDEIVYSRRGFEGQSESSIRLSVMMQTVFYFLYSASGMIAFALAVRPVALIYRKNKFATLAGGALLFLACSIGVYLGLVLRFNSWDFVARPGHIWSSVMDMVRNQLLLGKIFVFAGFLWFAYVMIDAWVDGISRKFKNMWS